MPRVSLDVAVRVRVDVPREDRSRQISQSRRSLRLFYVSLARLPGQNIRRQAIMSCGSPSSHQTHREHGACRKVEASAKSRSCDVLIPSILSPLGVEGPENTSAARCGTLREPHPPSAPPRPNSRGSREVNRHLGRVRHEGPSHALDCRLYHDTVA